MKKPAIQFPYSPKAPKQVAKPSPKAPKQAPIKGPSLGFAKGKK